MQQVVQPDGALQVDDSVVVASGSDTPAAVQIAGGESYSIATQTQVAQQEAQAGAGPGGTVRNRPRPDFDPLGIRAGAFVIRPSLGLAEQFQDNTFRTEGDRRADLITIVSPTLGVASDWGRHSIAFASGADVGFHLDNTNEDFQDYFANLDGRLDVYDDSSVSAGLGYEHGHVGRGDPDEVGGLEPTEFDAYDGSISAFHGFGRFGARVGFDATKLDYHDVTTGAGGEINNDDRDRISYGVGSRLSYEIVPQYSAFIGGGYNWIRYESDVDDAGLNRDSEGFGVNAGIELDFTGLIFGEFFVGYSYQDRADARLDTIQGFDAGGEITWNITPLTTIIGTVTREIRETTLVGSAGSFSTDVGLQVDHELLRSLIVGLNLGAEQNDFDGIDRTDYNFAGGVSVDYFINRYFSVGAGYQYRQRISDGTDNDFIVNTATVSANARF